MDMTYGSIMADGEGLVEGEKWYIIGGVVWWPCNFIDIFFVKIHFKSIIPLSTKSAFIWISRKNTVNSHALNI